MRYIHIGLISIFLNLTTVTCLPQALPIKPARTISFTTDEGTYMNVDVSPDGKTLVFDLLGDLYTVPATGGNATQLTRGIALNLRPVWSPDGKRIAYLSDISGSFHLNVRDLSGTFHTVLGRSDEELDYGSDAIWMPDGNYIAMAGSIYGLAGGKISANIKMNHPLRFSSDGRLVYGLDSAKIYVYDLATETRTALSPVLQGYQSVALSPNGQWWCYITDSNSKRCLVLQDLVNKTSRIVVPGLIEKDSRYNPGVPSPHFAFSPGSKSIFIAYGGKIHRIDVENGADQVIPFTAKVKSDLGPLNYNTFRVAHDSLKVRYTRSANASPDGRHLVFSALDRLYVMDLPKREVRPLVAQPLSQFQPVYSPDGQWIAYISWCDVSGGSLWRVPATGGLPEELTSVPGQYQRPAWSPDGKLIAVVRGAPKLGDRDDPGIGQLELIPLDGGAARIIDDSVPLWNQLAFSLDGNRIIYTPKYREDPKNSLSLQLVSKNLDGNDLKALAVGSRLTFNQQKSLSPDGHYIVYSADEDLYLVPVCKLTEPMRISDESKQPLVIRFAPGVDPYWEKGGKVLAWSYGNRFYRVDPKKVLAAAEKVTSKIEATAAPEKDFITAPVIPDEAIPLNVTVPSGQAHGVIALRNVRILTMKGDQVIEHGTLVIKNGRFMAVGPARSVPIPANAKILDFSGTTVMPGIVDLHLHMRVPPNVFPQQSWMFLVNLAYGVTTARDPSASFDSFGYGELLASGQMLGPRLFTVGRPVRFTDGVLRLDGPADARAVVEKRVAMGAILVKDYLLPQPRLPRQWLLQECHQVRLNITNEGGVDPILQLGMMKDGCSGVEHNPLWGDVYKDIISFVAESGTYFTPTLQVSSGAEIGEGKEYFKYKFWHQPSEKLRRFTLSDTAGKPRINGAESYEAILNTVAKDSSDPQFLAPAEIDARIRKQRGRVTLGSHGEAEGIGAHNEIWALQMGGISIMQALQAATIMGAEALGIQQDVGSIEVGKIADLLILNKNPLDDIHNSREIRYVMKDGMLYDGNTLDELWPTVKKCPEWRLK